MTAAADRSQDPLSGADEVGRRVHELRVARGLTQRELAAPRYTAAYVSTVEAGRRMPSTDALAHFAERLGTTAAELATGRGADHAVRQEVELALADAVALRDPAAAEAAYRRVAAVDPLHRALGHLGLGHLALTRGDLEAAGGEFAEAARLTAEEPAHVRAHAVTGLAECVRRQGDPRYAAYLLRRLLDELTAAGLPDPAALLGLHARLALCHADLGDQSEAASSASAALALAGPRDAHTVADMHLAVARSRLAAGDPRAAELALHQARQARRQVALAPELAACRLIRGRARRAAGDLPGALRDLTEARASREPEQAQDAAESAIELAAVYRDLGHAEQAHELLSALPEDQRPPAAERLLALLAADEGDLTAAERHLRTAAGHYRATGPRRDLAAVILSLAEVLERQGRRDDALAVMRDGLSTMEQLAEQAGRPHTAEAAAE